jgi:hypothetical protein
VKTHAGDGSDPRPILNGVNGRLQRRKPNRNVAAVGDKDEARTRARTRFVWTGLMATIDTRIVFIMFLRKGVGCSLASPVRLSDFLLCMQASLTQANKIVPRHTIGRRKTGDAGTNTTLGLTSLS